MADTLKAMCAEPMCINWGLTFAAPAYTYALADGDGIGFVYGAAAEPSPSKECHVIRGKVMVHPDHNAAEVVTPDEHFWLFNEGSDVPLAGIARALGEVEAMLPSLGMSRDQAFDYLQFWFPDDRFDYP